MAIQGNDLVSAVAMKLSSNMPDIDKFYRDKPRQNFEYKSIYIEVLNNEHKKEMRNRGERRTFLDVRIHPERDQYDAQSWCREQAERAMWLLAKLPFKGVVLQPQLMDSYYVEKEQVHHVLVVYAFKTLWQPEPPEDPLYLEWLEHTEHIKYGKE